MAKKCMLMVVVCIMLLAVIIPASPYEQQISPQFFSYTKYYPDGTVTTATHELEPGQTIGDACRQLLDQDVVIQQYIEDAALDFYFLLSAGGGFKLAFPSSTFGLSLLEVELSLIPNVIYCSYQNEADTTVIPLVSSGNATFLNGPHRLLTIGFVGILGWNTVFTFSNTFLAGFAPYVLTLT